MKPPCIVRPHSHQHNEDEGWGRGRGSRRVARQPGGPCRLRSAAPAYAGRASRLGVTRPRPRPTVTRSLARTRIARGGQPDDERSAGYGGAGHHRNAVPTAEAEGERQQHFAEPFMRDPRRARHRQAVRVHVGRGAVGDDPFAGSPDARRCRRRRAPREEKAASANRAIAIARRDRARQSRPWRPHRRRSGRTARRRTSPPSLPKLQ